MKIDEIYRQYYRDAVEGHASRFSVGFVFGADQGNLDIVSGVAVTWNGRRFILTAAHVFDGSNPSQVQIILPTDHPFARTGSMNPVQTEIYRTTETSIPQGSAVVRSRSDDLCCFEVDSRFGGASDLQFFNLPPFARTPRPGTACLMLGFPRDLSHVLSETERM
jgi:hypothetical protein